MRKGESSEMFEATFAGIRQKKPVLENHLQLTVSSCGLS
jgi:hypothetical protein